MALSDNVLNTLITTLGTTVVSVVVAYFSTKTRSELRKVRSELQDNSDDTKHIKKELSARHSEEIALSNIPVDQELPLGETGNASKKEGRSSASGKRSD